MSYRLCEALWAAVGCYPLWQGQAELFSPDAFCLPNQSQVPMSHLGGVRKVLYEVFATDTMSS